MVLAARRIVNVFLLSLLVLVLLVAATRRRPVVSPPPVVTNLEVHRSFAITDPAILDGFSFERVMNTLVDRSGVPGLTATRLYQQWFDTQNPKPGLIGAGGPHCDDDSIDGEPSFNGFPRRCPTPEGRLATTDPFNPPQYVPVALINRFDMTASDGSSCGQYRLIFARTAKASALDRVNLIFEPVLPNPASFKGLAGCRPVAQFWAELSSISSISERRARLENFFFNGIGAFAPVIHPDHLGANGGSIRALHYTGGAAAGPRFYQFRLSSECDSGQCTMKMMPETLENTVSGKLFDGGNDSPVAERFRTDFLRQVETLAIANVNRFFMDLPREFLLAESDPGSGEYAALYGLTFLFGQITPEGRRFRADIQNELDRIGSRLTPGDIVNRAETQSCVGCHVLAGPIGGGERFPPPFFFEHVSESRREPGEAGERFALSPAMRDVFIPHRMEILRRYLTEDLPPVHSNATFGARLDRRTLGGRPSIAGH